MSSKSVSANRGSSKSAQVTAKKTRKSVGTAWTNHCHICSELYGMPYKYVIVDFTMRNLYYNKKVRDEHGIIRYPKKLVIHGKIIEAVRDPAGYSKDAILVDIKEIVP